MKVIFIVFDTVRLRRLYTSQEAAKSLDECVIISLIGFKPSFNNLQD
jgi:hypothetical protein